MAISCLALLSFLTSPQPSCTQVICHTARVVEWPLALEEDQALGWGGYMLPLHSKVPGGITHICLGMAGMRAGCPPIPVPGTAVAVHSGKTQQQQSIQAATHMGLCHRRNLAPGQALYRQKDRKAEGAASVEASKQQHTQHTACHASTSSHVTCHQGCVLLRLAGRNAGIVTSQFRKNALPRQEAGEDVAAALRLPLFHIIAIALPAPSPQQTQARSPLFPTSVDLMLPLNTHAAHHHK